MPWSSCAQSVPFRMLAIATALAFASVPSTAIASDPTRLRLTLDHWPPYEYVENGQVKGYTIDKLRLVLKKLGIELETPQASVPWKRVLAMIESGEADVAVNGTYRDIHLGSMRYSATPITYANWTFFVRASEKDQFKTRNDLKGKTVGLVNGWLYSEALDQFTRRHSKRVVSYEQDVNFQRLLSGQVDYVIDNIHVGRYMLQQHRWQEQIVASQVPPEPVDFYAFFSLKTVPASFVSRFSSALANFNDSAEDKALKRQYGIDTDTPLP
ncbi:substrate-binding periplasmic protein [Parachitinimonas caeni]|uniref:Transporter substrate-binding domain-containing protein n=1 Tax=Parachitinimonas caeni TaxID=3031301 RepID=A0ABT7DWV3_9NEIS|nr:transporter substrate-binding domain-containing protein [Parachitinimonas caeni]MDK2124535.1 transporter substrate-binding domain-containing protein [Parachitinimonas caeni]